MYSYVTFRLYNVIHSNLQSVPKGEWFCRNCTMSKKRKIFPEYEVVGDSSESVEEESEEDEDDYESEDDE